MPFFWAYQKAQIYGVLSSYYEDPGSATFQRHRETKGWWICPRNPMIDGWRCDLAPFFDVQIRRGNESPARWIWGGVAFSYIVGIAKHFNDAHGIHDLNHGGEGHMKAEINWNIRSNHAWAAKRLHTLRVIRPMLLTAAAMCSHWVPRELFSQNFGRRNRRGYFDVIPWMFGHCSCYLLMRPIVGTMWTRAYWLWGVFLLGVMEMCYAFGGFVHAVEGEYLYPAMLCAEYGLPNGGEGWDVLWGGEMSQDYRMEGTVNTPFLQGYEHKVRNWANGMMNDHPAFRFDWGYMIAICDC